MPCKSGNAINVRSRIQLWEQALNAKVAAGAPKQHASGAGVCTRRQGAQASRSCAAADMELSCYPRNSDHASSEAASHDTASATSSSSSSSPAGAAVHSGHDRLTRKRASSPRPHDRRRSARRASPIRRSASITPAAAEAKQRDGSAQQRESAGKDGAQSLAHSSPRAIASRSRAVSASGAPQCIELTDLSPSCSGARARSASPAAASSPFPSARLLSPPASVLLPRRALQSAEIYEARAAAGFPDYGYRLSRSSLPSQQQQQQPPQQTQAAVDEELRQLRAELERVQAQLQARTAETENMAQVVKELSERRSAVEKSRHSMKQKLQALEVNSERQGRVVDALQGTLAHQTSRVQELSAAQKKALDEQKSSLRRLHKQEREISQLRTENRRMEQQLSIMERLQYGRMLDQPAPTLGTACRFELY